MVEWLILLMNAGLVEHASIIKAETKEEAMGLADERLQDVPWCDFYILHAIDPHPIDIIKIRRVAERALERDRASE